MIFNIQLSVSFRVSDTEDVPSGSWYLHRFAKERLDELVTQLRDRLSIYEPRDLVAREAWVSFGAEPKKYD